jgi:hypothetical protein
MANNLVLIMGESGTGKSTAIRTLNPAETAIINVLDKPLPFKGFKKLYKPGKGGNYFASDNPDMIRQAIKLISKNRPQVKNIVLDDFQYIMGNEFMRKAREKGFDKFTEIGQAAWQIIEDCTHVRDDLYIFILSHTEADANSGTIKIKTIGKMLDEKIVLEGMFTVVLHSQIVNKTYKFLTQHDGTRIAKSPMGMFERGHIDNDLGYIKQKMSEYYGDDEPESKPTPAPVNTQTQATPTPTQAGTAPTNATGNEQTTQGTLLPPPPPAAGGTAPPVNDTNTSAQIEEAYTKTLNMINTAADAWQLSKDFTILANEFNKFKGDAVANKKKEELKELFQKRLKELPNPRQAGDK